ncbi:MAG: capsid protein [Cressdnaviricota sp.]|nr:MAG: capsid protein [Cressdnaviricota sp.]
MPSGSLSKAKPKGKPLNKRQKKQVRRLATIGKELKFAITFSANGVAVTSAGTIYDLTNVAQGTTDTSRVGDRLTLCGKMELFLQFVGPESLTGLVNDIYNTIRIVVFQLKEKAVAGTNPITTDIFLNGPTGAADVLSLYNHDNRQIYTILKDVVINLVNNQNSTVGGTGFTTAQSNHIWTKKLMIPMGKKVRKDIQYISGGNNGYNKIFMMVFSDSGAAPNPTMTGNSKVFFRDA